MACVCSIVRLSFPRGWGEEGKVFYLRCDARSLQLQPRAINSSDNIIDDGEHFTGMLFLPWRIESAIWVDFYWWELPQSVKFFAFLGKLFLCRVAMARGPFNRIQYAIELRPRQRTTSSLTANWIQFHFKGIKQSQVKRPPNTSSGTSSRWNTNKDKKRHVSDYVNQIGEVEDDWSDNTRKWRALSRIIKTFDVASQKP